MSGVPYPNKTFLADFERQGFLGTYKTIIVVAAKDEETAKAYLREKLNLRDVSLTWLKGCNHEIIREQNGKPSKAQAKILYNVSVKLG